MDVFKYLKKADAFLVENDESQARKDAERAGGVTSKFGKYYNDKGQYVGKVVGDKFQAASKDELLDRMAKSPAGQAEPKTLSQFKKEVPQEPQAPVGDQMGRVVPGGPTSTAIDSGNVKEIEKGLMRGRGNVMSPARKDQVKQQARDILGQLAAEREAEERAAAKAEAQAQAELETQQAEIQAENDAEAAEIDVDDYRTVDDVLSQQAEEDEDTDEKFLDDYERITNEYKERLGELTAIQNRNVDKKFEALRKTFSKISDKDKRKAFGNSLALAYSYTGRVNSGAGKNALGKVDYELLEANRERLLDGYGDGSSESIKDFVESTRPIEVSDEEVEVFFDALPTKLQKNFMGAGKISDTYDGHSLGIDKDGNQMRGKLSGKTNGVANGRLRGLMVTKLFLQQGGKDGYTGADLDLNATDLEHVRGFNNKDDGDPTQEMKDQRENVDNFILTASNLNQTKVDKNMDEWYGTEVDRLKDFSDEDYQTRDTLTDQSNTMNDKAKLVNQLFFDGDKLSDTASSEMFDLYSKNDREMAKTINSNINKFGKSKGIKLPNVKNRIGYEMIKKLGLGGYMKKKSGRGNQGKLDDKIYSAFISTLMEQDEEGRERLSEVWKEGRELGSQAAYDQQNDGAAKATLIRHLKMNGGIADRFFDSKEFKRILGEAIEMGRNVIESLKRSLRDPLS